MSQPPPTTPAALPAQLVVFRLGTQRYALALAAVERVVEMVAIAPFPKAPEIVRGVVNLAGELVPVLDPRLRFGLPLRAETVSDQLLIARARLRRVALIVDVVEGVTGIAPDAATEAGNIAPGIDYVRGVVRVPDQSLIFIHDLDTFLSLDEEARIDRALQERSP